QPVLREHELPQKTRPRRPNSIRVLRERTWAQIAGPERRVVNVVHRDEDTPGNERQERRNRGNQQRLAARGDEERRNETRPGEQGSLVPGQCSAGETEHRPTE